MEHLLEMGLALSQFFKFVELFVAKLCFVVAYLSHVALVVKHELFVGDFLLLTHDHVEIKGIFYAVVVIVLDNFLQIRGSVGLGNNATREKGRLLVLFLKLFEGQVAIRRHYVVEKSDHQVFAFSGLLFPLLKIRLKGIDCRLRRAVKEKSFCF